ncbi:MAG: YaiI/YqxD family protein [Proteobacteria bacterium]|nr:YaiI/YqxD family protein [Pseudomonadota bacterium]
MHIWIDGDGCPGAVKDMVFRAAERLKIETTVVADRPVRVPGGPLFKAIVVPRGIDAADDHIVLHVEAGDLVITQDIPLAGECVEKGASAIEPRGELLDKNSIGARLSMRNFREELRTTVGLGGGPPPFGEKDRRRFAGSLDRFLAKNARK